MRLARTVAWASVPECPPRLTANGSSPRAGVTSTAAALAGTARPSHRPAPDRMSPSPRSPRSAPRVPRPGSALPDLGGRQPSGSRTACRRLPRTRAPSRQASGRSPRLEGVAPRPRRAACTHRPERGRPPDSPRRGKRCSGRASRTVTLIPNCGNSTGESPYSFANQHAAPLVSEVNHSASRTLTTNQPSVTGASPEPASSSRASVKNRILAAQATHP